jgi:membrane protease YdiL (CAAX protease family)
MVLFKRSDFWLIFTLVSCGAAFFSYQFIDKVYSLVNLSITADRHQVLQDAKKIAQERQWDIAGYQDVTSFESQDDLQCFVELEAGGKDAFVAMFESGAYYPYHWHVRFFKEKQVVEMHAWFAPDGTRLGFAQKVSEQSAGAVLDQEQAQALIENEVRVWFPQFDHYKLIEYDRQVRDTGRVDHDFTYERTDLAIGAGFYRFKAVVCGDVITRFEPSVKIPDNFLRRYQEMRSANNLLGAVGAFFFRSLYLLFFCLLGLVFFYRRNYLSFKKSSIAAAIVAGGMFLRGLNDFPLWATSYNTVQASSTFMVTKLFEQLVTFIYLFGMIFMTLAVAQAAGQWVYKKHVQFFKHFSLSSLGSLQVAQQIFFGYLMVPFMFAYVVIFGCITKTYCGWWSPAGSLFDPNVVASFFPWLCAITISLQAGFFEEVVCRALPIAMTAVLTQNSKHKKFWFVVMFIVQALIFGACHANYPNQPFYARLIELILPSFAFGWIYIQFGLLPGVITHFVYDVVWFAMPIFASNLFWSKVMVIFLAGLPLWIVGLLYLYHQKFTTLPEHAYNQAVPQPHVAPTALVQRKIGQDIPAKNIKIIVLAGLLGLTAWVATYKFSPDVRPLAMTKAQAIEHARGEIGRKFGAQLDATWTPITVVQDDASSTATRFVWQVYGKDIYNFALGSYLTGISWKVRFVHFSGAVEDRGQEYAVVVTTNHDQHPHVMKASHTLPEHFAGADIDQEQALAIVYNFIAQEYLLEQQDLQLISVNSDKFDHRRDWTIVVQDTQIFDFALQGQARIKVKVCGDQVCSYGRFVFVPEDWTRADQAKMMNLGLVKTGLWFLMFLLMALGLAFGLRKISASNFGVQMMRHKGLFVGTVSMIYAINSLSVFIGDFNTAEPLYHQLTRLSLGLVTKISYQILFCSIFLAIGAVGFIKAKKSNFLHALLLSLAAGWIIIGTSSLVNWFETYLQPVCGNYGAIGHCVPIVAFAGSYIKIFYLVVSSIIAMFVVLKTVRQAWPDRVWVQILSVILFCLSLQAVQATTSIPWMLLHGCVMGCVVYAIFYLLLQYDMTLVPLVFATVVMSMIIPEIIYPSYVGASLHGLVAMGMILFVAFYFYDRAHQE